MDDVGHMEQDGFAILAAATLVISVEDAGVEEATRYHLGWTHYESMGEAPDGA